MNDRIIQFHKRVILWSTNTLFRPLNYSNAGMAHESHWNEDEHKREGTGSNT